MLTRLMAAAAGAAVALTVLPSTAQATPPVGTCPDGYALTSRSEAAALGQLALAAFDVVNTNGDDYVCYKPYRNGPHHDHTGNFVDNVAAPHQSP